jgi:hypothetical protein
MAKRTSLDHLNDDEKYLIALGLFVEKFAACESMLIVALARLTRCDDPTSRAIFSGVRSDTARSHIRRILEARGEPMPEFLESSFQQLGIISNLRNDLMHYGAYAVGQNPDERTVSNEVAAMPGRERVTPISAEILTDPYRRRRNDHCGYRPVSSHLPRRATGARPGLVPRSCAAMAI